MRGEDAEGFVLLGKVRKRELARKAWLDRIKANAQLKLDNAAKRQDCKDRKRDILEKAAFWEDLNMAVDEAANADFWRQLQPMQATVRMDRFATNNLAILTEADLFVDVLATERADTGLRVEGQGTPQPPDIRRSAVVTAQLIRHERPPDSSARERLEALRKRVCTRHVGGAGNGA